MDIAELAVRSELPASLLESWGIRTTELMLAMVGSGLDLDCARALSLARSDQLLAEIRDRSPREAEPIIMASEWVHAEAFRIAGDALQWVRENPDEPAPFLPDF